MIARFHRDESGSQAEVCTAARSRLRRGSRLRTRFTVRRWTRLASFSRRRNGVAIVSGLPEISAATRQRSASASIARASHTLSNDSGQRTPDWKIQFLASENELRLRGLIERWPSCTRLIASASTASIRRCSLVRERFPIVSKNWLLRITSGKGRCSADLLTL